MKKIIVANWKMKPNSLKEAKKIFDEVKKTASRMSKVETVICPPFVYLSELGHSVSKKTLSVQVGVQNLFWEEKGSYTGEISVLMAKDLGIKYAIIGHSERRKNLQETNEMVNKKVKIALANGIKVILCIGESERDINSNYLYFLKDEIAKGLNGVPRKFFKNIIIAYEPIWAIGKKGKYADRLENVMQISIYIRRILFGLAGKELSRNIPILYGGSVEPENAEDLLKEGGVQGFLVGHASLVP
ncbi:MAG: triose-phosphate isomerase, partial [Patescibacteria group bacterium]